MVSHVWGAADGGGSSDLHPLQRSRRRMPGQPRHGEGGAAPCAVRVRRRVVRRACCAAAHSGADAGRRQETAQSAPGANCAALAQQARRPGAGEHPARPPVPGNCLSADGDGRSRSLPNLSVPTGAHQRPRYLPEACITPILRVATSWFSLSFCALSSPAYRAVAPVPGPMFGGKWSVKRWGVSVLGPISAPRVLALRPAEPPWRQGCRARSP